MVQKHAENQLPKIPKQQLRNDPSKAIIRTWEEIINNKHRTWLGYENDLTFHIPYYSKPIQFVSAGFLHENLTSPVPVKLQSVKCQYCQRVGHMEDQCFDLHPCQHCGKCNYSLEKCSPWVDQSLEMDSKNQEITSLLPKSTILSKESYCST